MTDHATGQTTTFTYDGNGALVKKVVGGVTTVYPSTAPSFLSGLRLRAGSGSHYEKQGSVVFKYFYFNGQRVAMKKDGVVYFLAGDHLGSTALTVSSGGVKVAELRYKAWGETRYTWGTTPTSFRYTGQRQEEGLGLYQMGARWVDPGAFPLAERGYAGAGGGEAAGAEPVLLCRGEPAQIYGPPGPVHRRGNKGVFTGNI